MAERITITVAAGGDDADARAFGAALRDVLDILDSLAKEQLGKGQPVTWRIVDLAKTSPPRVTLECRQHVSVARKFLSGWHELQQNPGRPFPPRGMRAVRRLCWRKQKRQVDLVTIESPGLGLVSATEEVAANADKALLEKYYVVPSSVDGKLDVVNVHHRTKFSVFDDANYHEVRCYFPDRLFDIVKRNLGKRVTVVGDVKFNSITDRAFSIRVDDIESLDENEVKPLLFSEMNPIDLTGGIPSEEYIRRLRNGGR